MGAGRRETPDEIERLRCNGLGRLTGYDVLLADLATVREELDFANETIGVDAFGDDFDRCVGRELAAGCRPGDGDARQLIRDRTDRDMHRC